MGKTSTALRTRWTGALRGPPRSVSARTTTGIRTSNPSSRARHLLHRYRAELGIHLGEQRTQSFVLKSDSERVIDQCRQSSASRNLPRLADQLRVEAERNFLHGHDRILPEYGEDMQEHHGVPGSDWHAARNGQCSSEPGRPSGAFLASSKALSSATVVGLTPMPVNERKSEQGMPYFCYRTATPTA